MIYTPLTNKAMRIAYAAHMGQVDKSGLPYIFHPYHLAEQMEDELSVCAALLHDVAEDTEITLEQLEPEFPPEVIQALRLLTHEKGTDYFAYIQALRSNRIARAVKLADIRHNADETRYAGCENVPEEQLARRRQKYAKARAILENVPHLILIRKKTGESIPIDILPAVIGRKSEDNQRDRSGFVRYEVENCHAISRAHARFMLHEGAIFVEDLGSTNGTYLNGEKLGPFIRTRLSGGDCLCLGIEEFQVSVTSSDSFS